MAESTSREHRVATAIAGVIGNVMEWYDFALYGYFASTIGKQFFPTESAAASLIASFGVFAAGFLMRPIGAALFGHIGDRVGRKRALSLSVILMAIPTLVLGCLPTYEQIGISAAVLLTVLRLVQGLSVGGEFTGSVTYVVETAPVHRRGLAGSWTTTGAIGGILLGSGIAALITSVLTPAQVESWGWRLPFIGGILVGLFGLYIRRGLPESGVFEQVRKQGEVAKIPLLEAFRHNGKQIAQVSGVCWGFGVLFYLPFVYMPTYVNTVLDLPMEEALDSNTIGMAGLLVLTPVMGAISDTISRKWFVVVALFGVILLSYPLFMWLGHETFFYVVTAQIVFAVLMSIPEGGLPALFVEAFDAQARYSAFSVAYNISVGLFGGTAPLVATWLISATGDKFAPAYYLSFASTISLIAVLTMRDNTGKPI